MGKTFGIITLLSFNIWTSVCQGIVKRLHLLISHTTTNGCLPILKILGIQSEVAVQTECFSSSYKVDCYEGKP